MAVLCSSLSVAPVVCIQRIQHLAVLPIIVTSVTTELHHVQNFSIRTVNRIVDFPGTVFSLGTAVMGMEDLHRKVHVYIPASTGLGEGCACVATFVVQTLAILTGVLIQVAVGGCTNGNLSGINWAGLCS